MIPHDLDLASTAGVRMRFFLHLPKTAGSTLRYVLERVYGDRLFNCPEIYPYACQLANAFQQLPADRQALIEIIPGHYAFGLHEMLSVPPSYLTLLRDPVDRVISAYYYIKATPQNERHAFVSANDMTLSDFLRCNTHARDLDNGMVRMIAGCDADTAPLGTVDEGMLERAKQNLRRHFEFVGITEDFARSIVLLKRVLGWEYAPLFVDLNKCRHPSRHEVSDEEREIIDERTKLDQRLYDFARQLFDERVLNEGPDFDQEYTVYRQYVTEYQHIATDLRTKENQLAEVTASRAWRFSRAVAKTLTPFRHH